MLKDINHIGLNVKDMGASVRFYRDVLGLEQLGDVVDQKDLKCRVQYMKVPDGAMIEFIEYYPDATETSYTDTVAGVIRHVAFTVEDRSVLDSIHERLLDAKASDFPNITFTAPDYLPYLDLDNLLVRDPNGIELEFCLKRTVDRYDWPQNLPEKAAAKN
jgi:catechol 2,3-dioxygenase-like lactoylglutathione lyase family enzyme